MSDTILFIPSGGEILLIFLVVLILFGADKIPDLARMLGKGMREFRKATDDIKREFDQTTHDITDEFEAEKKSIRGDIDEMKSSVDKNLNDEDPYAENHDEPLDSGRTFIDEDSSENTSSSSEKTDKSPNKPNSENVTN